MPPLSGAERDKRFREKNKARIRGEDALRKRHMRIKMKVTDTVKNEERLRKQRLYKKEYRKRIKTVQIEFGQRSTHMRSLRKAEKALPKSPCKQKAVVTSLAKKFNLKILPQQNNRGRKRQEITDDERFWLNEFLGRPDITYATPGKNDQVYMGKVEDLQAKEIFAVDTK